MEHIKGYVEHIIFQSKENGYTVLNLIDDGEEITGVGYLNGVSQGDTIEAEGEYAIHAVYGEQFQIRKFEIIPAEDRDGMERYLASGAIKGVGAALASRIVRKFKDDTFRIIEEEPERLAEVRGISERKAREISMQMEEKKELREALVYLTKYGISNSLAMRIYDTYGEKLYRIIKENPYQIAEDLSGVGFKTADEIAQKTGIHADSDYRIRSGVLYVLLEAVQEGNTWLPKEILLEKAEALLGVEKEYIEPALPNLMMDKKIVIKRRKDREEQIFSSSCYFAELNCARMLSELNINLAGNQELPPSQEEEIQKKIELLFETEGMYLDELQNRAVVESIRNGVFILSGGPGTGKTTTINTMIRYFVSEGLDILLAAPTGRAAKRMTEATGYEAKTIHRLLELNGNISGEESKTVHFEKNEENPLEADVVIIDEMSMVDLMLFQSLLRALLPGTRLIMVGDVNQLPSVGPGQILKDLICSGCFSVVSLEKIFRQAEKSDIVVNAHKIEQGMQIGLDNKSKDFFFLERNDVNVIYKHMIQLVKDMIPKYVKADTTEIQVLTPMKKGVLGVETLNKILQKYLNPPDSEKCEYAAGEQIYREGDKVMQIRNNYQLEWEVVSEYGIPVDRGLGIFNGDMGTIVEISIPASSLTVEFDEHRRITYNFTQLDEIELAYAITIHKSQGSEYPAVVIPLLTGPKPLFNRNLLYTAVTRARNCVVILGKKETVYEMIRNESENQRYTGLEERIKECCQ